MTCRHTMAVIMRHMLSLSVVFQHCIRRKCVQTNKINMGSYSLLLLQSKLLILSVLVDTTAIWFIDLCFH